MNNTPTESGLYWARTCYSKKFDYIINIKGESPFLNYIGWNLNYPLHIPTEDNSLVGVSPTKFIFGNQILIDQLEQDHQLRVPQGPGIYLVSYGDFELAYITGTPPYMSCFLWSMQSNLRKQQFNAADLTYLKEIEEPTYEDK